MSHSTEEVAGHILAASHILATEEAARHILAVEVLAQKTVAGVLRQPPKIGNVNVKENVTISIPE